MAKLVVFGAGDIARLAQFYFSTDSDKIKKYISNTRTQIHPESYVLRQYMSPHAAAELEGKQITLDTIHVPVSQNTMVIEGAG